MSNRIADPIRAGLERGWRVFGGSHAELPSSMLCDVVIVGTGAGAGITAELLAQAGLQVVMVEEGPLKSSSDFRQLESEAYPTLYQESLGRQTSDHSIAIMQGRCVGGSTTVNWTSSFRTPDSTLAYWQQHFGLDEFSPAAMVRWFQRAEQRLGIGLWRVAPNENNDLLRRGAAKLGIPTASIARNVNACWNLGSCGMGCPTNAKQSMLVTTLPRALDQGARLMVQTRAEVLELANGQVQSLICLPVANDGSPTGTQTVRIIAKHYVVAGGAINSPALMMRSKLPDPHSRLGRRTFLHPAPVSAAVFDHRVEGWAGAPQSVYSDHFLDIQPLEGPIGYKLEAPPIHPLLFAMTMPGFGRDQAERLASLPNRHALLALLRDGFHEQSPGGCVRLRSDGSSLLDYPLTDFVMDGARRAMLSMAEIQFAAGAKSVIPAHEMAPAYTSWAQARQAIGALPMKPLLTRLVSAHVMGGCGLAADEVRGVVRPDGIHWQVPNLSVHDGSVFPTSIGANPQLSIYGLVNRLASGLARQLTGSEVELA